MIWRLRISAGRGPVQVRRFVRLLADQVQGVVGRSAIDDAEAPRSVLLLLDRRPNIHVGSHVLIDASPRTSRKRWYAGVWLEQTVRQPPVCIWRRDPRTGALVGERV